MQTARVFTALKRSAATHYAASLFEQCSTIRTLKPVTFSYGQNVKAALVNELQSKTTRQCFIKSTKTHKT